MNNYDFYDKTFAEYKKYIQDNSKYNPNVVKYSINTINKFPTIIFT